jgi:hypothetical protein
VKYNFASIKVDWLAACIALRVDGAVYLLFSSGVGVQFVQSSSQWQQGLILEAMSQTLLTNKNPGNLD